MIPLFSWSLLLLLSGCLSGASSNYSKLSSTSGLSLLSQQGIGGCGKVTAPEETDSIQKTFKETLDNNYWQQKECLVSRQVVSFGGAIWDTLDYSFNTASTTSCSDVATVEDLQSAIPSTEENLLAFSVSQAINSFRLLTWVTEDTDKKQHCMIMAVDVKSSTLIRLGALEEVVTAPKTSLSLSEYFATVKWNDMEQVTL